jgi:protoheme IX farnesyltransferase
MLPVVKGVRRTKHEILAYTFLLAAVSFAPVMLGHSGMIYALSALALNGAFLYHAAHVWRSDNPAVAMKAFGYSIFYLFALFGGVVLDAYYQR